MLLSQLNQKVKAGEKLAMLTCYDATFAKLMEQAQVDILLVGDSLGMVLHGAENTLNVSMHHMSYHTKSVATGAPNTFIIADMPLGSYEHDAEAAYKNAEWLIKSGAHMVKFEGGGDKAKTAHYLVERGIPVCAHLGFTPQSVNQLGGYKIQGKTVEGAAKIMQDAISMANAGASFILFFVDSIYNYLPSNKLHLFPLSILLIDLDNLIFSNDDNVTFPDCLFSSLSAS